MSVFSRPWFVFIKRWLVRLALGFVALSLFMVLLFKWVNPTCTFTMLTRKSNNNKTFQLKKEWKSIDDISVNMQLAAICGEDQHFCEHYGFDFTAIKSAVANNMKNGSVRGASTISQQTAKNVFLWEGRSWLRKGLEAWFTLCIELIWGKKRIMEVYLNVAETGEGMFGVEAAARKYYGTSAKNLTRTQAAAIVSILPSPRKWRIGGYPAIGRQNIIMYAMNTYGIELKYLH